MSIEEARIKHERAKEMGRSARRNGSKREANPYRAGTSTSERDSWFLGFDEVAAAMRVRRG